MNDFRAFMLVLCVALAARGGAMLIFHKQLQTDTDSYGLLAKHLVNDECYCLALGHPTAFRPPLYPLLLAPWALSGPPSTFGIVVLHLTLSALTIIGVYVVALQWSSARGALVAGLLTALDPLLIYQSAQIMTETLAAAMVVMVLLTLSRLQATPTFKAASVVGISLGLSVLCRPTFLFWVPLVAIGVLWTKDTFVRRLQYAALVVGVCTLALVPWIIRNWLVVGHPVIATTHGGYTLWLANNNSFYDYLESKPRRGPWLASAIEGQQIKILRDSDHDEIVADGRYQELALETMRRRPATFAHSCAYRIGSLWHPLAAPRGAAESWYEALFRYAAAGWYVILYCGAVAGALRLRQKLVVVPWWWVTSLLVAFTFVHMFYWTDIRMRAPLIPALALLVATTLPSSGPFRRFPDEPNSSQTA